MEIRVDREFKKVLKYVRKIKGEWLVIKAEAGEIGLEAWNGFDGVGLRWKLKGQVIKEGEVGLVLDKEVYRKLRLLKEKGEMRIEKVKEKDGRVVILLDGNEKVKSEEVLEMKWGVTRGVGIENRVIVGVEDLKRILGKIVPAVTTEDNKYITYDRVLLEGGKRRIRGVGTDGKRLVVVDIKSGVYRGEKVYLPRLKVLKVVNDVLKEAKEGEVVIDVLTEKGDRQEEGRDSKKYIKIGYNDGVKGVDFIIEDRIGREFPDYRNVLKRLKRIEGKVSFRSKVFKKVVGSIDLLKKGEGKSWFILEGNESVLCVKGIASRRKRKVVLEGRSEGWKKRACRFKVFLNVEDIEEGLRLIEEDEVVLGFVSYQGEWYKEPVKIEGWGSQGERIVYVFMSGNPVVLGEYMEVMN